MESVMIANTTQLEITVSSAKCPFIEIQLCLKMTQTLVLVSSLFCFKNTCVSIWILKYDTNCKDLGWFTESTSIEK